MSEPHVLSQQSSQELFDRVEVLSEEITHLRAAVDEIRLGLSTEVRTRSVVVVDHDGFERIVMASRADHGAVSVYGRSAPGGSTCAELFANDPIDGDGAHAGVSITDSGEVVAVLEVLHGNPAHLHVEAREPPG